MNANSNTFQANISLKYISWQGTQTWAIVAPELNYFVGSGQIVTGNFLGDNSMELFKGDGQSWKISKRGYLPWQHYASSGYSTSQLKFKDINGDNFTDVLVSAGNCNWLHSDGSIDGTSGWQSNYYTYCGTPLDNFKDFDSDGLYDIFLATGTYWYYYSSKFNVLKYLNTSGYLENNLLFGDFDGNGTTDIMSIGSAPAYDSNYYKPTSPPKPILILKTINSKDSNNFEVENNVIHIFPNPVKDFLSISAQNEKIQRIIFLNIQGKIIKSVKINKKNSTINCNDLQTGIYILKIESENKIYYDRILKSK